MSTPSLHDRIVNIPINEECESGFIGSWQRGYRQGHRDARHAAAELALEADAVRDELVKALRLLVDLLPDPELDTDDVQRHFVQKAISALAKATKEQK